MSTTAIGPLPRVHGFHRGWDDLVHIVLATPGHSMKDEVFIDYQAPCFFLFEGPDHINLTVAIVGRRESPSLCDGPATCLTCLARQGDYGV